MSKWQTPIPAKPQLALVCGGQGHDLARIGAEIIDPVAVFRRDDESEMMPVSGPGRHICKDLSALRLAINTLGPCQRCLAADMLNRRFES